ncbi:MAG TPA: hypothetical protein VGP24_05390 [Glaciihabitans sp.]|jgi:hypothetical protein|nr:hypothetical protein [Glaciihabitans sp.]
MRWENLFDDLENQLASELENEVDLRVEDERLRLAKLTLLDRLVALSAVDPTSSVRLVLTDGSRLSLTPSLFGADWCAGLSPGPGLRESFCIVPLEAVSGVALSPDQIAASLTPSGDATAASPPSRGLRLGSILRDLCRRRENVEIVGTSDRLFGTIDRVGDDHFDLAIHELGTSRQQAKVSEIRLVPVAQLLFVRV